MKQNIHTLRGRLWLLLLAMLTIVSQETQAQALTLNDASSNSTAISDAVKAGGTYNATLSGRTIYRDGDWNTLCLPFSMNSTEIASSSLSPLAGAIIKELNTGASSLDGEGKLTLKFTDAADITAGKPYIVKWVAIKNDDDWDAFVANVGNGMTYEGKTVILAGDINISTGDMVGSLSNAFMGTFDGCGHTINCDIDQTGTGEGYYGVAPFCYINGATIKNVKVTGTVKAVEKHCAGLVGYAEGTCTIQNCWVDAAVTCTSGAYCGGVLGHAQTSVTTISNCLYSGKITGNGSTAVGVISGWSDDGGNTTINNCLADGTYTSTETVELILGKGTKTTNSCIKRSGEKASDLVASLGSEWKVSDGKAVPKMTAIGDVTNPEFSAVTLSSAATNDVSFDIDGGKGKFWFKGTYDPKAITTSDNILLLSSGNRLGYVKSDRTLNAFRAYFEISGTAAVRSYALDFGDDDGQTTGIINVQCSVVNGQSTSATYDLQGRRVIGDSSADNVRLKKGLYIRNGRKVIIK